MGYLLQHLLTEAAAREPRRPAVATGEQFLTYEELDRLSNQVARALLAQGVAPGDRVGIFATKSAASVVAAYGVLKAGAVFLPLTIVMVLLSRCALMGIPANASPVEETTLPASSDGPSAASVALGDIAQAAAKATAVSAVPT